MIPQGGTFVRPGVIAWDGIMAPPAGPAAGRGYSSCEIVEQAIAAAAPGRLADLLDDLARARLWLPLPDGPAPVTDGSAVVLPVITWAPGTPGELAPGELAPASDSAASGDYVPAFTSVQRLAAWAGPRALRGDPDSAAGPVRSGDPAWARDSAAGTGTGRHIVVPFPGLASHLPPGLGIAINPGTTISLRLSPTAVALLSSPNPHPAQY